MTAKLDFVLFCLLVTNLIIRLSFFFFFFCLALIRTVDKVSFKKRRNVVFKHDYTPSLCNQDKAIMIVIYS